MRSRWTSAAVALIFVLGTLSPAARAADKPSDVGKVGPRSQRAVGFAETPSLRELWARQALAGKADRELVKNPEEINELNSEWEPTPDPNAPPQFDGALQTSLRAPTVMPGPSLTFEANSAADNTAVLGTTFAPPDTNGDVGPNDYVQTTNVLVRVWDKAGAPRGPAFLMHILFANVPGPCSTNDQGDPIVVYDRLADRWLLSQFAFASQTVPPFYECIAISKTPDPTGPYYAYAFQTFTPPSRFPDYPKLAAWSDAYYMTTREFTPGFNGHGAYAFDRAKMLIGDASAAYVYFHLAPTVSNASSGTVPTTFQGIEPPPAGAPNLFAIFNDDNAAGDLNDSLRLFDFHADFAVPANSTFNERADSPLLVAAFNSISPNGRADIEQPPPAVATDNVDSIGDRLMPRLQYVKRGTTESWVGTHTVNAGTPGAPPTPAQYQAAPRVYELFRTSPAGAIGIQNQVTFAPDTTERWMPSAAMDGAGDVAVGYSVSSTAVFPGIRWAGRLVGSPANTLAEGEAVMFPGAGVQQVTGNRWGDYSSMSLDPDNNCNLWYTQQYQAVTGQFSWQTRVGTFAFPSCTPPIRGTLAGTVTTLDTGLPLANSQVSVSGGGPSDGFATATLANGTYSMDLLPGTYTVTISNPDRNCSTVATFPGIVITGGNTTTQNATLDGQAKYLITAQVVGGNNGIVNVSDCTTLDVTVRNVGCHAAAGIAALLSTTTPNVSIWNANESYPDINPNAVATGLAPFQISTSASFVCGSTVDMSLTLNSADGSGTLPLSVGSCAAAPTVFTGSIDLADPTLDGRMGRNGVSGSCATPKACPGNIGLGTGLRNFDTFTVVNGALPVCLTATLTSNCTQQIQHVAYLNAFVPTNVCTNYLADAGSSPVNGGSIAFSTNTSASQTTVYVVNTANAATTCTGAPNGYTLTISGLLDLTPGAGECTTPVHLQKIDIE